MPDGTIFGGVPCETDDSSSLAVGEGETASGRSSNDGISVTDTLALLCWTAETVRLPACSRPGYAGGKE
jgi:hypothetical protein